MNKKIQLLSNVCAVLFFAGFVVLLFSRNHIGKEFFTLSSVFTAFSGIAGIVFMLTAEPVMRRYSILWIVILFLIASPFL